MDESKIDKIRVCNTIGKFEKYLHDHNSICVGVSGGSDSNIIVHIIATYFRNYLPKVHFVFENTGLEYKATLRHLDYMEDAYNIHIDKVRGRPVPAVVREYGVPILSKDFSYWVSYAQKGKQWAIDKINKPKGQSFALSDKSKALAKYLIENNIKVSYKCCDISKKAPHKKYLRQYGADLTITGERKCEGGARAGMHKSCFETGDKYDKFMPLFFWNDETKQWYKEHERIVYSDCYEIWGMRRTGCVGCPFNGYIGDDLKKIKQYEPNLYKACMNVFGESYRLMDMFNVHRHKIFDDYEEIRLDDYLK